MMPSIAPMSHAAQTAPTVTPFPGPATAPPPMPDRAFDAATPRPSYLRSYADLRTHYDTLAAKHPDLISVEAVGPSTDTAAGRADRPLFAARVAAKLPAGMEDTRPVLAIVAGVHSDETANPELVTRFVDDLVAGYGTDPQATHLLRTRQIVVVPMANPDGHAAVERGFETGDAALIHQRRSGSSGGGVDLNRNFDWHWGAIGGASDPTDHNYRGTGAASEVEVQSLQKYLTAIKPSMVLDVHSRGKLLLIPFGDTADPAPDARGLAAIAGQMTMRNGYLPETSWDFHPDSATLKDWAYGTMRVPAYTLETGENHHQTDADFAETLARNLPVLRYAASIVDAPFARGTAPSTDSVQLTRATGAVSAEFAATPGAGAVAGAELIIDPKTPEGKGIPMAAADGAFDGARELVSGRIPDGVAAANRGATLAYVRGRSGDGTWGPLTAAWLTPPQPQPASPAA